MEGQVLKVLLVEDNPGDAFLIKFYMSESTNPVFEVDHAEDMKTAIDLLSKSNYDIILTDMNLPDSFGIDTLKTIVSNFPGNLVIVLTGFSDEEVGLETVRYGAQDFLVKGKFDGKVLVSTVMFAFERFKLNKQIDKYSKQLLDKSARFDNLQRILRKGYVEVNFDKGEVYWSGIALEILELGSHHKYVPLSKSLDIIDKSEHASTLIQDVFNNQTEGSFTATSKGNGKTYAFEMCYKDGIIIGTVQLVS